MKKIVTLMLAFIMMIGCIPALSVRADDDIKPTSVKITKSSLTVYKGDSFELKAKMNSSEADDDYLRWKIVGNKNIIRFEDDDRDGDEAEFKAVKTGSTKVKCYIKGTKEVSYVKITVKPASAKLRRVGGKTKKVEVDDDLELKVKISGVKSKYLKWSIKDKSILRFEDGDNTGKEVDVEGIKTGKTTVTCTNKQTKKKITYTIVVIPETDD